MILYSRGSTAREALAKDSHEALWHFAARVAEGDL
jgi:hypothetical protein